MKLAAFILGLIATINCNAAPKIVKFGQVNPSDYFISECASRLKATNNISVKLTDIPVIEDYSQSVKDLSLKTKTLSNNNLNNLGNTYFYSGFELTSKFESMTDPNSGLTCIAPSIDATVSTKAHVVYIASDFKPQSCLFNYIRQHEYTHVAINKQSMADSVRLLQTELNTQFNNKIFVGRRDDISKELNKSFQEYWLPRAKSAQANVLAYHTTIDTPEEYAKIKDVCGGAIKFIKLYR